MLKYKIMDKKNQTSRTALVDTGIVSVNIISVILAIMKTIKYLMVLVKESELQHVTATQDSRACPINQIPRGAEIIVLHD